MQPLTDQQLIGCLKEKPATCPLEDRYRDQAVITGELGLRKHLGLLIAATIAFDHLPHGPAGPQEVAITDVPRRSQILLMAEN